MTSGAECQGKWNLRRPQDASEKDEETREAMIQLFPTVCGRDCGSIPTRLLVNISTRAGNSRNNEHAIGEFQWRKTGAYFLCGFPGQPGGMCGLEARRCRTSEGDLRSWSTRGNVWT